MRRQFAVLVLLMLTLAAVTQSSAKPIEVLRDGASGRMYAIKVTPPMAIQQSHTATMCGRLEARGHFFTAVHII